MQGTRMGDHTGERGDIVVGWLTKVVVTLALFALAAFDTISIATARFGVTDDANSAAESANSAWTNSSGSAQNRLDLAYNAAAEYAEQHGETCPAKYFSVSSTGEVRLRLERKATTLLVGRIGPLKKVASIHGNGEATTPQS